MNFFTSLVAFFNSNFFVGGVTFLAGFVALIVYLNQKSDHKKDAANIILLEIQNAERLLVQARELLAPDTNKRLLGKPLLPTASWDRYKYLFVREFDRDEWDTIANFYANCKLYDESVTYNNSFFQKNEEQIRVNITRVTAECLKTVLDQLEETPPATDQEKEDRIAQAFQKAEEFQTYYLKKASLLLYEPMKPINDAISYVEGLDFHLSQSSIGTKLKTIAKIKV